MSLDCGKEDLYAFHERYHTQVKGPSTFINAFESSPVHCLNLRPCLNRRKPANGGANAILGMTLGTEE